MVYDYVGKADLSKGYWNPKRELGVTKFFLEVIKQQKKRKRKTRQNTKQCMGFFSILKLNYL